MAETDPRQHLEQCIEAGKWVESRAALEALWMERPTSANANFVSAQAERLHQQDPMATARVAFLRSFTLEPVVPLLRAAAFVKGIRLETQVGEFNSYPQEILDPASKLYQFAPDVAILAVQTRDIAPELWNGFADLTSDQAVSVIQRVTDSFRSWIAAFRSHSQASLIVHSLELPSQPSQGILDGQLADGQSDCLRQINRELKRIVAEQRGVYLLDYDALVARCGRERWGDELKWLSMRMPFAAESLLRMANEWLRFLYVLIARPAKVLVTDLDNTLWGGVLGEDRVEGIALGMEHPGASYLALQRVMLDLHQRGVLLATASKNDSADALNAIETHPEMLLRARHFSATRINWTDKAENLVSIAKELNVGLDSLCFIDDSDFECARVREALPQVRVIPLPKNPGDYAKTLRESLYFERLSLSEEDRERGRLYAEQHQRTQLSSAATNIEDFYRSLEQEAEICLVTAATMARTAQLTQKTNQFNMTTRRYTEQQIAELAGRDDRGVYTLRVKDRFGDNGLVGVAIVHHGGEIAEIDTLLLSCRVIGRTVETALLAFLAAECREKGAQRLEGWFLPTPKNQPAENVYASHQFQKVANEDRGTKWSLDLMQANLQCPEWIRVTASTSTNREYACR
jgi:FkbH-like protein